MNRNSFQLFYFLSAACLLPSLICSFAKSDTDTEMEMEIDFERDIRPVLKKHCIGCHGPVQKTSGLRLDAKSFAFQGGDSGPVLIPGQSQTSELWLRIHSDDDANRMPPEGEPLSETETESIRAWIDSGANWPETVEDTEALKDPRRDHWAWQPILDTIPPSIDSKHVDEATLRNPIDHFIVTKQAEFDFQLSPEADRRTLIRRLAFDLHGLPPTPEQIVAFESDRDPMAYEKLVEQLLDSPRYGERSAQHWLDLAHFADTHGFERDQIREHAWRYRDWVIQAFNEDLSYDQFVRLQIAGDTLAPDDPNSVVATGFLAAGPWDFVGQAETPSPVLKRLARADDLDDMVTQVIAATCAVTINCARCHDHKLDPISHREYYALSSVFAGTKRGNRPVSTGQAEQIAKTRSDLKRDLERLMTQLQTASGPSWSLADIVGGGDGRGTGKANSGIDPITGQTILEHRGFLEHAKPNQYVESPLKIVDGVSIPDGGDLGYVTISSTGLMAHNVASTSGKSWDAIRNGPVHSLFSTKLGETDYADSDYSLLGMHSNSLITFDLKAIADAPADRPTSDEAQLQDSSVQGVQLGGGRLHGFRLKGQLGYFGQTARDGACVLLLVDGKIIFRCECLGRDDGPQSMDLVLPEEGRFLTFIVTDLGKDISHDQVCFINTRLERARTLSSEQEIEQQTQRAEIASQIKAVEQQLEAIQDVEQVYAVLSESPPEVHVLSRGDTEQPRDLVSPGSLTCLAGLTPFSLDASSSDFQRRLALANWITDSANPLFARVMVNRLWQQHFGVGIVATPSDFGLGGTSPTHPELLDWLASYFKQNRYSMKAMHRLICNSATYRQRSSFHPDKEHATAFAQDASNRWLWRQNVRKLDAESTRDAILAASGRLETTMYGPGFREFDYKEEYAPVYSYIAKDEPATSRRSIYRFRVRTTPNPWMASLDCPNSANLTPTRNVTTTALQSLAMLNDEFVLQQSVHLAKRVEAASADQEAQIGFAWQLLMGRKPSMAESEASRELVQKRGLPTFCRYLFNSNEFVSVD